MFNKKDKSEEKVVDGFYKGYDLGWLKRNPEHPDFYLVAEAEGKDNVKKEEVQEESKKEEKIDSEVVQ